MALYLLVRWAFVLSLTLLVQFGASLYDRLGMMASFVTALFVVAFTPLYFVLVDRTTTRFHVLAPEFCSIYDPYFWSHERYWKVPAMAYIQMFNGTPFKALFWRLLGVPVGRRLFDDGCWFTERALVSLGSDCTLNEGTTLQSHSLEDGTFKSDHIAVGDSCTIGVHAFVHYGVAMRDGAVLDADSFLMKGEDLAAGEHWCGNPARAVREASDPLGGTRLPLPAERARTVPLEALSSPDQ